jgi:hypothetical protein|tara:strand:+ start:182 stop:391 length:210 start_codon:yes stop_codon:yes gene_type:complete
MNNKYAKKTSNKVTSKTDLAKPNKPVLYNIIQKKNTLQNDRLSARIVKIQFTVFDFTVLLIFVDYGFEI